MLPKQIFACLDYVCNCTLNYHLQNFTDLRRAEKIARKVEGQHLMIEPFMKVLHEF